MNEAPEEFSVVQLDVAPEESRLEAEIVLNMRW